MAVAQRYVCRECGREHLRWEGRCPGCEAWNSLEEVVGTAGRGVRRGGRVDGAGVPAPLREAGEGSVKRLELGFGDMDAVLGGGLVEGSIALLGGTPGVGKSTLVLHAAACAAEGGATVLYASGEESADQVRGRAQRIGSAAGDVLFLAATSAEAIVAAAGKAKPALLVVDSIQTTRSEQRDSAPGSVPQVREAAEALRLFAKRTGTPTLLVGHVTKGGALAGPRTLEHLVDVVLHLEGARGEDVRILRATKNRFGRVGELAVFRMSGGGLEPVPDPGSELFRHRVAGPGSALTVTLEGARPVPVEVQALTSRSPLATPRRMTTGFPPRRLAMLLAVLDRHGGIPLDRSEVFVNVVGGFRVGDPGADAGVLAALISAELGRVVPHDVAFLGEAGLSGELRAVDGPGARLRELARIGVAEAVVPAAAGGEEDPSEADASLRVHRVARVRDVVEWIQARVPREAEGSPRP